MLQYIEKQTTKQLVFTNSVFHYVSIIVNKLDKSPHMELIIRYCFINVVSQRAMYHLRVQSKYMNV